MRTAIAAAVLLMLCASAGAQNFAAYKCNSKSTMELGKNGPVPKHSAIAPMYRAELVIDRKSGKMLGGPFGDANQYSVWHPGDNGASFKAVYTSPYRPILYLLTLQILENEEGAVKLQNLSNGRE